MSSRDNRLDTDEDFILSSKHDNSINKYIDQEDEKGEGVSFKKISRLLKLSLAEVQDRYVSAMKLLKNMLSSNGDE